MVANKDRLVVIVTSTAAELSRDEGINSDDLKRY